MIGTLTDQELFKRMKAGDEEAYAALYQRTQAAVYRFLLRLSGSPATAEDVTQEVFLALLDESDRFDALKGSVLAYLYGMARNHLLRRLTKDRPYVTLGKDEDEDISEAMAGLVLPGDPLGDLTRSELIDSVRQAVQSLPLHYREVIVLCDLEETTYELAAESLDCSVGTIRSRLHRGRALLLRKLKASGGADPRLSSARPEGCWA